MKNEQLIKEWGKLTQLFDNLDNIELTYESCMDLAAQAEKIAKKLDPERYTADKMRCFLEPHFEGVVRKSGDLYINRQRIGQKCYVYFAGKQL